MARSTAQQMETLPSFHDYGAQTIRENLRKMLSLIPDVREAKDIEAIHDMRVASRRLRAAISVFEPAFPAREYRRFERNIKLVTRALGEARDLDVMIEALSSMESELPPREQAGIEGFLEELREKRQRLQTDVNETLDEMEARQLEQQFDRIADAKSDEPQSAEDNNMPEEPSLYDHAIPLISARVADLLAWEEASEDPARIVELHEMRIGAKRLRYTMELFAPFYDANFAKAIGEIKAVQEHLGNIHDADVLVPQLLDHLRDTLKRDKTKTGRHGEELGVHLTDFDGAAGLLAQCRAKRDSRDSSYNQFRESWLKMRAKGFFDRLWVLAREQKYTPKSADAPSAETTKPADNA